MTDSRNIHSIGYDIFAKTLDELPTAHQTLINTINQYSFCIAEKDAEFKTSLQNADVLLADGIAIVGTVRMVDGVKIKKIAGADLHKHCLDKLQKNGGSCFYLGSSDATLQKIVKHINSEYPNIKVGTYSPPYKPVFTAAENAEMLAQVNAFKPDVLFVGMTAPKQEKWAYANKQNLNAQLICSVGAVFDFYAGTVKRPSKIWVDLGLEWLGRFIKEPKRMWKRYIYYGFVFFNHVIRMKFKKNTQLSVI